MISAITNMGSVRFMVYEVTMTQQRLLDFMRRLVMDAPRNSVYAFVRWFVQLTVSLSCCLVAASRPNSGHT